MTCKNRNIFEGECGKLDDKGRFNKNGIIIYLNRDKNIGNFVEGRIEGNGKMVFNEGKVKVNFHFQLFLNYYNYY